MGGLTLVAFGIRLAAILVDAHKGVGFGDAYVYNVDANLLAHGVVGINPFPYVWLPGHPHVASAAYPPLFSFVLGAASSVGAQSFLTHRIWCAILGAAAVPLGALVGRQLVGRRVGLLAGVALAVDPNLWMANSLTMSETIVPLVVLLVLLAAYHFWKKPTVGAAALLGGALGAAALARDELSLLVVFVFVPLVWLARVSWAQRGRLLGCGLVVAALIVTPWVGWNMARFNSPVLVSDGLGITMAQSECNPTWYGKYAGWASFGCGLAVAPRVSGDEAQRSSQEEHIALRYVGDHLGSVPAVAAERVGRTFGLYRPLQQMKLDSSIEKRPYLWAMVGLGLYYVLVVFGAGGAVVLRRRRVPLFPLLAMGATAVVASVLTFGDTRFATSFEVALALLAAVGLDALVTRLGRRQRDPDGRSVTEKEARLVPAGR